MDSRSLSALQAIPCPGDYETWNRIGIEAIAAGLSLDDLDAWSSTGPNYKGARDVKSNFKGVKQDGGIGPGSLLRRAMEHGWEDTEPGPRINGQRAARRVAKPTKRAAPELPRRRLEPLWESYQQATETHEYIQAKDGRPDGLRVVPTDDTLTIAGQRVAGWVVVPAFSLAGELRTLQFIPPPGLGKKLNLPGASFEDGLFVVGDLAESDLIYIVEGIGQAWACWKATGKAAVVCFGAGRMGAVAELLRKAHPNKRLIFVPDRGKEAQSAAVAAAVGGSRVELPQDKPANYDANDYAQEYGADALAELLAHTKKPPQRFNLLTAAELASLPGISWRVRGVIPAQGIGAIFGPSGSGKSFLALDMLAAIAMGRTWFGSRVSTAQVVYVALEGEAGITNRAQAYMATHGPLPGTFRFLLNGLDIRNQPDRNELVTTIKAIGHDGGVLVLDTLNRAAPGMDENSSQDMGQVIDAMKALQAELGGLVLVVHHSGKDQTKGMRGHSSLHAALDAAIEVTRTDDRREWKVAKSKDGEDGEAHPFRLDVVDIGTDEDGEPITSCVVVPGEQAEMVTRRSIPKGGNQRIVWDALGELLKGSKHFGMAGAPLTRPCVNLEEAIQAIAPRLACEDRRKVNRTREAFTGLIAGKVIEHMDEWVWIP